MDIAACTESDLRDWAALRLALWPHQPVSVRFSECEAMLLSGSDVSLQLIARVDGGQAAGFAEASVRRDYVNGCTTSPVAFLEGIYVRPENRTSGIGQSLVAAIIEWARSLGLTEFASDASIDDDVSHRFHRAVGFVETERVVFFGRSI